jgi:hypothetical protein
MQFKLLPKVFPALKALRTTWVWCRHGLLRTDLVLVWALPGFLSDQAEWLNWSNFRRLLTK